ncbi:MAG: hypothetical protein KA479_03275 [Saprospiraceae bacterium]|jgi:hypothetical protein|nr:hypothetical protein [Saprospiraceae bacterium]
MVDPEVKLKQIEADIRPWMAVMGNLADQVRDQDVSRYPIFVVHPATIELGLPVVEKGDQSRWSIHISTLEEFSTKQIILADKIENFKQVYKNPSEQLCLFVLSDLGATFVFIPRIEGES